MTSQGHRAVGKSGRCPNFRRRLPRGYVAGSTPTLREGERAIEPNGEVARGEWSVATAGGQQFPQIPADCKDTRSSTAQSTVDDRVTRRPSPRDRTSSTSTASTWITRFGWGNAQTDQVVEDINQRAAFGTEPR